MESDYPLNVGDIPHTPEPAESSRLDELVRLGRARPLSVVRAPAGYGKTTYLKQLALRAMTDGAEVAWCRLEIADENASGVVAALASALGCRGLQTHDPSLILAEAVSDAAADGRVLIVLDDAHRMPPDSPLWPAVGRLLDVIPPRTSLAIGTREDVPLRLGRLRANGAVGDVSASQLVLGADEVRQVIERRSGPVSDVLVQTVYDRTAGWPACVSLIAGLLAEVDAQDAMSALRSRILPGGVYQFFAEELAAALPESVLEGMVRLSVVDEFDLQMAGSMSSDGGGEGLLAWARRLGVLRDDGRATGVCSFHPLFRQFLAGQLDKGGVAAAREARRAAAAALLGREDTKAAIDQLLAAGDETDAAELILQEGSAWLREGHAHLLDRWLSSLRAGIVVRHSTLLALHAETDSLLGRDREAADKLCTAARLAMADEDQASSLRLLVQGAECHVQLGAVVDLESVLSEIGEADEVSAEGLRWQVASLWGVLRAFQGEVGRARALLEESLGCARVAGKAAEARALGRLGSLGCIVTGDVGSALDYATAALEAASDANDTATMLHALSNRAVCAATGGRWRDAESDLREALRAAVEKRLQFMDMHIESNLALVEASRGELQAACERYGRSIERARVGGLVDSALSGLTELAQLVRARGAPVRALQLARRAARMASTAGIVYTLAAAHLEEAACLAAQDRIGEAQEILQQMAMQCEESGMLAFAARARYQLACTHLLSDDPEAAEEPLSLALRSFQDLSNLHYLIVEAHGDPGPLLFAVDQNIEREFARHILERADKSVRRTLLAWLSGSDDATLERALRLVRSGAITDPKVVAAASRFATEGVQASRASDAGARAALRMYTFGGFVVEVDGQRLERADWVRLKARDLLRLLAAQPNHCVSRDELLARFWPDSPEKRAVNSAHVVINALRKTLEPDIASGRTSRFIVLDHGVYSLVPGAFWLDSEQYERELSEGEAALRQGDVSKARDHFASADRLYGGDYMADDLYGDAYFASRERYRQMHQRVLQHLVEIDSRDGSKDLVPQHLRRVAELDPWNEDVWARLLTAHAEVGDARGVREAYEQCRKAFCDDDEEGVPPSLTRLKATLLER